LVLVAVFPGLPTGGVNHQEQVRRILESVDSISNVLIYVQNPRLSKAEVVMV